MVDNQDEERMRKVRTDFRLLCHTHGARKAAVMMLDRGEITREEVRENKWLLSVTQRVNVTRQPHGGYLPPRGFDTTPLDGGDMSMLHPKENINAGLVGSAVDYLSRYMTGTPKEEAFKISRAGARLGGYSEACDRLLNQVTGLDDDSIIAAVKLTGYDSIFRAGPSSYQPVENITPDEDTVDDIRIMVERAAGFLDRYGPKTHDGMTFDGGYTLYVAFGDADFMTQDTLWDFKTTRQPITSRQPLQLLIYYLMGLHSDHMADYMDLEYLGFFNPRHNTVRRIPIRNIPHETIDEVATLVIGYDDLLQPFKF